MLPERNIGFVIVVNALANFVTATPDLILQHAVNDKYGIPAPTNTVYFPDATQAVSQAELDALAGIYAAEHGYHRVVANPESLTLFASAVHSNMLLRTDGWFTPADDAPITGMLFTNLAGRTTLVWRTAGIGFATTNVLGERFDSAPISAAWSNRLEKLWFALDESPVSYYPYLGAAPLLTFTTNDGVLLVESDYISGSCVLSPTNDDTAFVCGLMSEVDSAVQVFTSNTFEYLRFAGYTWQPEESIPELTPGVPTSGTNMSSHFNWYRADLPIGTFTLTCTDANIRMIIYEDLDDVPVIAIGSYTFALTAPGTVYVALGTLSPSVPYELDAGRAPLLLDRAQATPSGMVLTWISQPGTNYAVAIATNLLDDPAFVALPGDVPAAAGISTTWTAAPSASPSAFYRVQSPP